MRTEEKGESGWEAKGGEGRGGRTTPFAEISGSAAVHELLNRPSYKVYVET